MIVVDTLVVKIITQTASFKRGIRSVIHSLGGLSRALDKVSTRVRMMGTRLRSVGRDLSLYLTAPLAAAGAAAFKTGSDFEEQLAKIEGLVGIQKDVVQRWGDEILKLAPEMGKSPLELVKGLYMVTTSGIRDAARAMDTLTLAAKASAGHLGETKVIAHALTSAMNAYEKEGLSAARATDILTVAVRHGKLESDAIAKTMGRAIAMSANLGVSFEDTAGQIAIVSKTGETASRAVTSFAQLMMNLLKPSKSARDTLAELSNEMLTFEDLRGMVKGPMGTINVIKMLDEMAGGDESKIAAIIPDMRSLRGVMTLLARDSDKVREVMDAVHNSTGAANRSFEIVSQTVKFKLNQALARLSTSWIELYQSMRPIFVFILDKASQTMEWFTNIWKGLGIDGQKTVLMILAFGAALGPTLVTLGMMANVLSSILGVMSAIASPVGLVVVGLAALAHNFLSVGASIDWVKKKFQGFVDEIQPSIEAIRDAFSRGDFTDGVEIMWAQIKVVWFKGMFELTVGWNKFLFGIETKYVETMGLLKEIIFSTSVTIVDTILSIMSIMNPAFAKLMKGLRQQLKEELGQAIVNIENENMEKLRQSAVKRVEAMGAASAEVLAAKLGLKDLLDKARVKKYTQQGKKLIPKGDTARVELPGIPSPPTAGRVVAGATADPRAATTVGSLEHLSRLNEYRAGLPSRKAKSPEVSELEAVNTKLETLIELQERELEEGPIGVNIDPAAFEGVA